MISIFTLIYEIFFFILLSTTEIILLLLLLLLVNTFMQCIYNHIPESNHVSRGYYVAALMKLQFVVYVILFPLLNVLYFYISVFKVCVPCPM